MAALSWGAAAGVVWRGWPPPQDEKHFSMSSIAPLMLRSAPAGASRSMETHVEAGSARDAIADGYAAAVRANDFHDDRQAEPAPSLRAPLPRQKRSKMRGRSSQRDAQPTVENAYRTLAADLDDNFSSGPSMNERIFDQIAQCIPDRFGIPGDSTGCPVPVSAIERPQARARCAIEPTTSSAI